MDDIKTLIAIPAMETVATPFMYSLVCMRRVGLSRVSIISGSLVYSARNMLAAEAIDSGCDRVLWLDSDMQFSPDLMERLAADMDEGAEYVCGLFFRRKPPITPLIYKDIEGEQLKIYNDYPADRVFEIAGSGFGAVMISAKMLKQVYDAFGPPFNPGGGGLGEDVAFCVRARKLGCRLYCDSRVKVGHIGTVVFGEDYYKADNN